MFDFLTDEQNARLQSSIAEFKGHVSTIETAIGAIVIGQRYGWRVLRMVHSSNTMKKYEKAIGLSYEEICPEETELSTRNVGYRASKVIGKYWDIVMGRHKVERKAELDEEETQS
ncbi:hypothetical protein [Idiomarina sp. UBA3162]|uniref:hypothetical protein n=1 Tax=Idiomarina sp. UBA3162 TaxID=1946641 RepID=UPI000C8B92A3|nr:hypothetical protein [Idiomarina sp. UBA3162]MAD52845.1 hypothetical protein [Idiomarinaceae bacterium]|tara:strand:+ start:2083 stop:2427 length:345 start_codon:yes stop_codon:yes gene_type:complete